MIPEALIMPGLIGFFALWFAVERSLTLMMFFQQEEYDGPRFLKWLQHKNGFDKTASTWLLAALLCGTLSQLLVPTSTDNQMLAVLGYSLLPLAILGLLHGIGRSRSVRKHSKKPLVLTARAKRILYVYGLIAAAILCAIGLISSLAPNGDHYSLRISTQSDSWWDIFGFAHLTYDWQYVAGTALLIVYAQCLPLVLVLANKSLEPMEERVKAGYRAEAVQKFKEINPRVIAITGSFGKTSTKHILSHILGAGAPALATPGSVNTEMGITRVIREQLKPEHQYFIVEMGAYGPGSIARLCKLTPPDAGLITAIGAAHYERFKSLETVAAAKFELAEAVFEKGGGVVVSTDGIEKTLLETSMKAVPGNYTTVGPEGDISLAGFVQDKTGLTLTVKDKDEVHILKVPLFGRHQSGNILLAAACARSLGMPWAAIKGALASMPQIRHRLEVSQTAGGPTLVNDAYNSNPVGFASALESLDALVDGGKRILVTPGMVELGAIHDTEHERLGALAAQHCDIVLVVTPNRIPSFLAGLNGANTGATTVMTFEAQAEAETWVKANWKKGDVVLFENNLPDLYESHFSF
ncbi:Mur ligase family protein [Kordiimonas pumila]|uniref:Mur ligase family protein n=1 Tax=Kordiimonas pumila TaxID=2161677 RepID=A0ABV7DA53_9PROT|nr:UDP-N-acetylmuramoyl-tripeptide--D-alanyl-D-alanine ligase [Kordiimonas pumila]